MAMRTALGSDFYIWHPQAGIQQEGTLYIVAHSERTLIPTRVSLPAGTSMEFLSAAGENLTAAPIQDAFSRGGTQRFGTPRTTFVDNYNLFKSPSNAERPSGNIESYITIAAIPDEQMIAINSDILTVRKRAWKHAFHSGAPFIHRGADLKEVFAALVRANIHYQRIIAYFCRGNPFQDAPTRAAVYAQQ